MLNNKTMFFNHFPDIRKMVFCFVCTNILYFFCFLKDYVIITPMKKQRQDDLKINKNT